jgi:hypothetical protein
MNKAKLTLSALTTLLLTSGAYASPVLLSLDEMDSVVAGTFVCPVINTDAVLNAKNGIMINGAYSVKGPDVSVPVHATNDNGAGSPGGSFASPGDTTYTAIWN